MRSLVFYILSAVVFFSCNEPFELDLDQAPARVVIEGLVTDHQKYQSVRITSSTDFYSSGQAPRITDATVTVKDDVGNTYNFVHNPNNHPDSAGIYVPQTPFDGVIGRTYFLTVTANGNVYEASDKLVSVIPIDSLAIEIDDDEQEDPEIEGKYYEVLLFAREPQDISNFYLFKFYRNDSLNYEGENDIYYSDDELLAENIDGIPAPIYFGQGDVARIEIFSLSRVGFVYYNDLATLLNSDGGMFGPVPASPRTNLSNNALGFFQVSAVASEEIVIE